MSKISKTQIASFLKDLDVLIWTWKACAKPLPDDPESHVMYKRALMGAASDLEKCIDVNTDN